MAHFCGHIPNTAIIQQPMNVAAHPATQMSVGFHVCLMYNKK